jgi:hypothetical protein
MKKKSMFWLAVVLTSFCFASCAVNKKAQAKADEFNKSMMEVRDQVYSSVISAKNDKSIDSSKITELKKQYATVQESFNNSFDKITKSADSNKLDQAKCAVLNYKRVMAPYKGDFESSSKLANDFNQAVLKARNVSAIGITDVVPIVVEIFKALAKERIRVCKDNITAMKYKDWDDIKKTQ